MALSGQVSEYINEAQTSLREALAFAARSERPFIMQTIADVIGKLDSLLHLDGFLDNMEDMMKDLKPNDGRP